MQMRLKSRGRSDVRSGDWWVNLDRAVDIIHWGRWPCDLSEHAPGLDAERVENTAYFFLFRAVVLSLHV